MDWDKVFCVVILRLFHYFVTQSVGFGHAHDHGHGGDGGHGHGGDGVHGHGGDGGHGHQDFRRVYEHQIDEGRVEELVLMESWKDYDEIYIRPGRPVVNGQDVGVVRPPITKSVMDATPHQTFEEIHLHIPVKPEPEDLTPEWFEREQYKSCRDLCNGDGVCGKDHFCYGQEREKFFTLEEGADWPAEFRHCLCSKSSVYRIQSHQKASDDHH